MAAETEPLKFKIGTDEYEIPPLDDLDMDEWQIVYDYSGLILEDFAPAPDRADEQIDGDEDGPLELARQQRVKNPAFTTALLHIGYRRSHPDAKFDAVKKLVGGTKRLQVLEALADAAGEGGDDSPPASTLEREQSSHNASGDSSEDKSNGSQTSSGRQAGSLARIGTSG